MLGRFDLFTTYNMNAENGTVRAAWGNEGCDENLHRAFVITLGKPAIDSLKNPWPRHQHILRRSARKRLRNHADQDTTMHATNRRFHTSGDQHSHTHTFNKLIRTKSFEHPGLHSTRWERERTRFNQLQICVDIETKQHHVKAASTA